MEDIVQLLDNRDDILVHVKLIYIYEIWMNYNKKCILLDLFISTFVIFKYNNLHIFIYQICNVFWHIKKNIYIFHIL